MSATAALNGKIQIAPDSSGSAGTYATLGGQLKVTLDNKGDVVDISQLGSSGWRAKIQTLKDTSVKIDMFYDNADTAQGTLRSGLSTGTQVWAKVYADATHGFSMPMIVTDISYDLDPAGVSKCSVSLDGNGALTSF